MQLPTQGYPSNPSAVNCQRMDISMVLNTSEENRTASPNTHEWNEKAQLQNQQYRAFPPMRTEPPRTRHSYDGTQGTSASCFDCFGLTRSQYPQDHAYQPISAAHHPLPSIEGTKEGYVRYADVPSDFKVPSMQAFDHGLERLRSQENNRTQIDSVRLNRKKSPRRASTSPTIGRHTYRLPVRGVRSPQPSRPTPSHDEENVMYLSDEDPSGRGSCNRPYNIAQIDWIRYSKIDLSLAYDALAKPFAAVWPGEGKTGHCFSARFYRDNWMPRVDSNNDPVRDAKGRLVMDSAKMRDMKSEEGREKCIPYSLVERYPWRAIEYRWVREEHKEVARAIMRGLDPSDPTGKKSKWREALWKTETFKYREYI